MFVNNVSLGLYAMIVRTEGYRENKPMTAWHVLPSVLGPRAAPVDLRFTGPDGREHAGFQLILASNGPYRLTADRRLGSREGMDLGILGIFAAKAGEGEDLPAFAGAWWTGQADPSRGWLQWVAAEFEADRAARSRRGWTARLWCSTHRFSSAACQAPFGFAWQPSAGPIPLPEQAPGVQQPGRPTDPASLRDWTRSSARAATQEVET